MQKILMSGFEPFGDDTTNPALEAIKLLEGKKLQGGEIITVKTPVVRFKAIEAVINAIEKHKPNIVVTVGQAGGRAGITPERVAINIDDFRIKDNEGNQVIDEPIIKGAPKAYFSTLPIKAMVQAMQQNKIPSLVSNTAGTFVCNHLFYGVCHYIASKKLNIRHGFVHIPLLPEQATIGNQPTMGLETIVKGLEVLAQAILDNKTDINYGAGTIC